MSPRTLEYYAAQLREFQNYAEAAGVASAEALKPAHLRQYLSDLSEHRNSGGVHCAYRSLKTFLLWYEAETEPEGWKNPIRKVKNPDDAPLQPIPLDDLKAMLATCDHKALTGSRDAAILLTLLDTGLRASELISLNLADVNLSSGTVIVRHGKGGKYRTVFMCQDTARGNPLPQTSA